MNNAEIKEALSQLEAFGGEGEPSVKARALMQDPIVANRLAVELLQKIDPGKKPALVLSPAGEASYFGYSAALASWTRFLYADIDGAKAALPSDTEIKQKERTLVVLDHFDVAVVSALLDLLHASQATPLAVLCIAGADVEDVEGVPVLSLL